MKRIGILSILWIAFFSSKTHSNPISPTFGQLGSEVDYLDFGRWTTAPFTYSVSSSLLPELGAFNLFDTNPKTYWYSGVQSGPEWIIVDFGSKRLINGVEISVPIYKGKRSVSSYEIQVLYQENWKTILKNETVDLNNFHQLRPIDASVLKITFPKSEGDSVVIGDFKIFLNTSILNGVPSRLTGYYFPIPNGILPLRDYELPGAPREYRNGIHKGLDIYYCRDQDGTIRKVNPKDSVISPADGVIVRADWDYSPMTMEEFRYHSEVAQKNGVTYVEKDFGGRQVWIDHGNGVMSSFNHLSTIKGDVLVGTKVKAGQHIGTVGNSGLMGEAKGTEENTHLHFEIWIDGEYLGAGVPQTQVRKLLQFFFSRSNLF
ncbi:peptidase M23 [Leptospira perolatii]|uniref:Peptidase M23 n=1 Tax=Leptospira perolatii TaxID=2023191 RepID=A0A2M9ZMK9_9LEPT|nr:M23 family metallopeptidase [Leptospira perolatii]PJZ70051.1 peptidase M23 [Leptospira perolatii]PJZ73239.1 peptidase M23 [Leptospira perolatii]